MLDTTSVVLLCFHMEGDFFFKAVVAGENEGNHLFESTCVCVVGAQANGDTKNANTGQEKGKQKEKNNSSF